MSEENSRPTCPFKLTGPYVPPRFQQGPVTTGLNLGPLAFLAGSWRGPGFNAIWRPDNPQSLPQTTPLDQTKRFLELNLTHDSFDFHVIPGVVPNRGLNPQTDLSLYGLHYLQRVSDADPSPGPHVKPAGYSTTAKQALHIEPGLFMNVPASTKPPASTPPVTVDTPIVYKDAIVRMASIPHGVTVLMQGPNPGTKPHPGKPHIPHLKPFSTHGNEYPGLSPSPLFPALYPGANPPLPLPPGTPERPAAGIPPIELNTAGSIPAAHGVAVLLPEQRPVPRAFPTLHRQSQLCFGRGARAPGNSWTHYDPSHDGYSVAGRQTDSRGGQSLRDRQQHPISGGGESGSAQSSTFPTCDRCYASEPDP
jgi:hypothetical protein